MLIWLHQQRPPGRNRAGLHENRAEPPRASQSDAAQGQLLAPAVGPVDEAVLVWPTGVYNRTKPGTPPKDLCLIVVGLLVVSFSTSLMVSGFSLDAPIEVAPLCLLTRAPQPRTAAAARIHVITQKACNINMLWNTYAHAKRRSSLTEISS